MPTQQKSFFLLFSLLLASPAVTGGDWVASGERKSQSDTQPPVAIYAGGRKHSAMPQSPLACEPRVEPSKSQQPLKFSGASKASSDSSVPANDTSEQPVKQAQIAKVSAESISDSQVEAASFSRQKPLSASLDFGKPKCELFGITSRPFTGRVGGVQPTFGDETQVDEMSGTARLEESHPQQNASYMDELMGLIEGQPDESVGASSYLTDLNQLLGRQADWILARGSLVDLTPGAPVDEITTDSYLDDLRRLHPTGRAQIGVAARQLIPTNVLHRSPYRQVENDAAGTQEFYEIPAESHCVSTGGKSADGLFQPLASINVRGVSSAPPKPPKNVKTSDLKLTRPSNDACAYLSVEVPTHYFTSGYGFRRSPRNTLKFCHNPLYFEDPNQERCGQSKGCLTTACSAVHFTTMASLLPYLKTVDPPNSCVAALSDCPTCSSFASDAYFPEWSWKAAAVQTAAVTGLVFVIP